MLARVKFSKVAVVIFLTILIWVWADLAKTENFPVANAVINVAKSTSEDLWVSFDDQTSVRIKEIILRGATSRIDELQREIKIGRKLQFELDVAQETYDTAGNHTLPLLPFLRKQRIIKERGLEVLSCQPDSLSVKVVKLRKETLEVKCVDDSGTPIPATINPSKVDIYVPDTNEAPGFARIQLNSNEIEQAKETPVSKKPFFQLAPNQIRKAQTTVSITIKEEQDLKPHTIESPAFGLLISELLKENYDVKIEKESAIRIKGSFKILATSEAKRIYENMTHQVILEIKDNPKNPGEIQKQELIYNFPHESLRKNKIKLGQNPEVVHFRLIPRPTVDEPVVPSS
jgi:hypothetical protein